MAEEKNETTRLSKSKPGYGYKYTELAQINELLEQRGESYYQYTENFDGKDYIMTVKVSKDGKEAQPLRGAEIMRDAAIVAKGNPAQQIGAAITYARRYSLLMAYGLATEDDDAASLTPQQQSGKAPERQNNKPASAPQPKMIGTEDIQYINKVIEAYPANKLLDQIKTKFRVNAVIDMTEEQGRKCVSMLNAFESAQHPTE
jgi:hypothetical protein